MFIALAAVALGSATVQSSGSADLDCVLNRITAADRLAVANETLRDARTRGPASAKIERAAADCATQRRWDGNYAGSIAAIAFSAVVGEQAELELKNAGIETSLIDAWFDALPVGERNRVLDNPAVLEGLFARLQGAGTPADHLEANGEILGLYVGALAALDRLERGVPL